MEKVMKMRLRKHILIRIDRVSQLKKRKLKKRHHEIEMKIKEKFSNTQK